MKSRILEGDVIEVLKTLQDQSVHCIVTSPPYWRLRDYGVDGQIGMEKIFDCGGVPVTISDRKEFLRQGMIRRYLCAKCYVCKMVAVFRDVKRVLRDDGVLWMNLGDSYAGGSRMGNQPTPNKGADDMPRSIVPAGLKAKDLIGNSWIVALALQKDGWYLRSDVIWHKPNPMPESCRDRPSKSHEYIFLLSKNRKYYYDAEAVGVVPADSTSRDKRDNKDGTRKDRGYPGSASNGGTNLGGGKDLRNLRTVWAVASQKPLFEHYASFPEKIAKICILASTSRKGSCANCGAPWIPDKKVEYFNDTTKDGRPAEGNRRRDKNENIAGYSKRTRRIVELIGWLPGCDCAAGVVPCVVMDIFGGTGTVRKVAMDEGRIGVTIDIKPEYNEMNRKRTSHTQESFA